jgi:hypothetical protein
MKRATPTHIGISNRSKAVLSVGVGGGQQNAHWIFERSCCRAVGAMVRLRSLDYQHGNHKDDHGGNDGHHCHNGCGAVAAGCSRRVWTWCSCGGERRWGELGSEMWVGGVCG